MSRIIILHCGKITQIIRHIYFIGVRLDVKDKKSTIIIKLGAMG